MLMKFCALLGSRGRTGEPVVTGGRTGERDSGTPGKRGFAKANEGFSAEGVTGMIVAISTNG